MPGLVSQIAEKTATHIDRRRFMRRSAQAIFVSAAGIAAGGGLSAITAPKALANACGSPASDRGPGCPSGAYIGGAPCGPSPCCGNAGSGNCNCANGYGTCKSKGSNSGYCEGEGFYYSSNCWSCVTCYEGNSYVAVCCDCAINSAHSSTCKAQLGVSSKGYWANRCISYEITKYSGC